MRSSTKVSEYWYGLREALPRQSYWRGFHSFQQYVLFRWKDRKFISFAYLLVSCMFCLVCAVTCSTNVISLVDVIPWVSETLLFTVDFCPLLLIPHEYRIQPLGPTIVSERWGQRLRSTWPFHTVLNRISRSEIMMNSAKVILKALHVVNWRSESYIWLSIQDYSHAMFTFISEFESASLLPPAPAFSLIPWFKCKNVVFTWACVWVHHVFAIKN